MLEKWEQEIIDNVEPLVSLDKLIAFMQQGQCLIAADGSASNNMMSFVWGVVGVNVYLDNKGVIEKIAKQQTYSFDYSFHMIDPNEDIITKICDILELMNIKVEFKHVKEHQDDVKHYKEPDLPF
eukprot:15341305-Ditylum_brightwellii.AAC.1